jgi:hypothetical protein
MRRTTRTPFLPRSPPAGRSGALRGAIGHRLTTRSSRRAGTVPAVNKKQRGRSYRFYYFLVVTICVLLRLVLVLQAQPFIIWLAGSVIGITLRSVGGWQIMLINNRQLHPEFRVSKMNTYILWFTVVSGFVAVALWFQFSGLAEIRSRWGL